MKKSGIISQQKLIKKILEKQETMTWKIKPKYYCNYIKYGRKRSQLINKDYQQYKNRTHSCAIMRDTNKIQHAQFESTMMRKIALTSTNEKIDGMTILILNKHLLAQKYY